VTLQKVHDPASCPFGKNPLFASPLSFSILFCFRVDDDVCTSVRHRGLLGYSCLFFPIVCLNGPTLVFPPPSPSQFFRNSFPWYPRFLQGLINPSKSRTWSVRCICVVSFFCHSSPNRSPLLFSDFLFLAYYFHFPPCFDTLTVCMMSSKSAFRPPPHWNGLDNPIVLWVPLLLLQRTCLICRSISLVLSLLFFRFLYSYYAAERLNLGLSVLAFPSSNFLVKVGFFAHPF